MTYPAPIDPYLRSANERRKEFHWQFFSGLPEYSHLPARWRDMFAVLTAGSPHDGECRRPLTVAMGRAIAHASLVPRPSDPDVREAMLALGAAMDRLCDRALPAQESQT